MLCPSPLGRAGLAAGRTFPVKTWDRHGLTGTAVGGLGHSEGSVCSLWSSVTAHSALSASAIGVRKFRGGQCAFSALEGNVLSACGKPDSSRVNGKQTLSWELLSQENLHSPGFSLVSRKNLLPFGFPLLPQG